MISWRYEGVPLLPDSIYDCHGVYSGSAIAEKDKLHLFYTGNIKMDGDYDYINNGRQSSTLHVESEDGIRFERKSCDLLGRLSGELYLPYPRSKGVERWRRVSYDPGWTSER